MRIIGYLITTLKYIRKFGFKGFIFITNVYWRRKGLIKFSSDKLKLPVYLRSKSTDYETFMQVFYNEEYDFNFPGSTQVIVDCGANIGLASIYFKNRFPDARIIAIEPDSGNYEMLLKNTAGYSDITCIKAGIWNSSTNLEVVDLKTGEWAYQVIPVEHSTESTIKGIGIKELMDSYQLQTIDILKVDIEGSEKELFELGQDEWLPNVDKIIIETHDRYKKGTAKSVFNALAKYDFTLGMKGENMIIRILK